MNNNVVRSQLTISFDPPFYKAVFERYSAGLYEIGQVNLGPTEPKITGLAQLINERWDSIDFFQQSTVETHPQKKINPKRLQRLVRKSSKKGIGIKAQVALQKQREQQKSVHKKCQRKRTQEFAHALFIKKQQKRRLKRRGH